MNQEDNRLGYMTFDRWKALSPEERDFYLWDAMVNRCKTCGAVTKPWWKFLHLGLVTAAAFAGGMVANICGLSPKN